MTAVYARPVGYARWCRLRVVGGERHVMACGATIPAVEPLELTAFQPDPMSVCSACQADLSAKRIRGETLDMAPRGLETDALPIDVMVSALQDVVHEDLGPSRPARAVREMPCCRGVGEHEDWCDRSVEP